MKTATLLAAVALALGVQAASAAPWKQVTASGGANTDQVSLARAPDGVLHVAWRQEHPNTADLFHTAISAAGKVGATNPIVTGWVGIQNPALVWQANELRVFFGGQRTINTGDPDQDLETATSSDGGAAWNRQIGSIVPIGAQAYGSPVSATVLPSGAPLEAWAGTLGTWVHWGLSPSSPNYDYQAPLGHYGYDPGIASDATARAVMAWYSNATGHLGVWAQDVNPGNGAPAGAAINMPHTSNMNVGMIGRTPIVARPNNGGFYVAYATGYPALNRILLWRVGGGTSLVSKTTRNVTPTTTVATDGNGRLWVAWTDVIKGKLHVLAGRLNRTASKYGAVVDAGRPAGASSIYRLDANATAGALDVFANSLIGVNPATATYYKRVLPGLTLLADPQKLHRGKKTDVTFIVRDAGDPVEERR